MAELEQSFYDPNRTYQDNVLYGPFGEGAKGEKYTTYGQPTRLFFGQPVHLDLGISAGPLVNGLAIKAALDLGWDVVTYKTVRSGEYPVNGYPNLLPTELDQIYNPEIAEKGVKIYRSFSFPSSPTNSFGVPSAPPEVWLPDATDAVRYARRGQVVVVSFQGTPRGDLNGFIRDHVGAARLAKQTGAQILEVNQSCPNEGSSHLLCLDYKTSGQVVEAIRVEIGDEIKLLAKICYFSDQELLQRFVQSVGPFVDGITTINTMAAKIVDSLGAPAFGKGRERAGLSGEYIRPYGLDMTRRITRLAQDLNLDLPVVGVGGVFNKNHYLAYKEVGASGVEVATGFIANPKMIQNIKAELGLNVVKVS